MKSKLMVTTIVKDIASGSVSVTSAVMDFDTKEEMNKFCESVNKSKKDDIDTAGLLMRRFLEGYSAD